MENVNPEKLQEQEKLHTNEFKASVRVTIASMLIGICFTVFALVWAFDRNVKLNHFIMSQLIFAMPILYYSTTAYSKLGYKKNAGLWNKFAVVTFIIGYSLIINAIGIMIYVADLFINAILFFVLVWLLDIIYSICEIAEDRKNLRERIVKTGFFILATFGLGLFVILNDRFHLLF